MMTGKCQPLVGAFSTTNFARVFFYHFFFIQVSILSALADVSVQSAFFLAFPEPSLSLSFRRCKAIPATALGYVP